jgi:YesN/AraC family two-component response regulator
MLNAFEHNGIDYLLKPVDEKELDKSLKNTKCCSIILQEGMI